MNIDDAIRKIIRDQQMIQVTSHDNQLDAVLSAKLKHGLAVFERICEALTGNDFDGNLQYAWGVSGDFPGGMWGVHGMSFDEEGNFYVAEVDNGRIQKFTPREGANPDYLVARPQ